MAFFLRLDWLLRLADITARVCMRSVLFFAGVC